MAHSLKTLVPLVTLPNGVRIENAQTTVVVDDTTWANIPTAALGVDIQDLGAVIAGDAVTVQAAHVAAPAALTSSQNGALTSSQDGALTSSQNATANANAQTGSYVQADVQTITTLANALKVSYNAAQTDLAALRTAYNALQADVVALRTSYNAAQVDIAALQSKLTAEIAALEVASGPQA